jgi:hypothetical protein
MLLIPLLLDLHHNFIQVPKITLFNTFSAEKLKCLNFDILLDFLVSENFLIMLSSHRNISNVVSRPCFDHQLFYNFLYSVFSKFFLFLVADVNFLNNQFYQIICELLINGLVFFLILRNDLVNVHKIPLPLFDLSRCHQRYQLLGLYELMYSRMGFL